MKLYNLLAHLNESEKYYNLIDNEINEIVKLIRMGHQSEYIRKIHKNNFDFLYEFAMARIKIAGKFSRHDHLFMDYYSSMYSTPEIVGKYRAKKLAGNKIVDAGSGSGMQDIMLSEFSTVTGIEIDANRFAMANLNKIPYNSNANFINDNIFSFNGDLPGYILFSDPLRPVNSREKLFSQLLPNPLEILQKKPEISGYAIDLPPHMEWDNIPLKGEKEYISIKGILNRLTLYSPSISAKISTAVILPENIVVTGEPEEYKKQVEYGGEIDSYLYIPDISITYAKLLHMVIKPEWKAVYIDERRQIFSGKSFEENFPGKQYSVLASSDDLKIIPLLRNIDAGKIFFRFKMEPEETYVYKNSIEKELTGSKNIYIFRSIKKYILAEEIN
jgi:hypothetical protein